MAFLVSEDASYIFGETLSVNGEFLHGLTASTIAIALARESKLVFDVSHWHFPLYVSALVRPLGVQVVGISDGSFAGPRFADQLNCKLYGPNEDLQRGIRTSLWVFSRHSEMAGLA